MFNTKDKGMKRTYAIGIDPGQTGAIAIFQLDEGEYYLNSIFDYADKDLFIPVLREISLIENCTSVCIESVHSAPGHGVSSTFKFGANFGWWIGVLDALGYSYTLVAPQKWQGLLFKDFKGIFNRFPHAPGLLFTRIHQSFHYSYCKLYRLR